MRIKFVKQDCWLGLYWKTEQSDERYEVWYTTWYLCLIPCFPIIWSTKRTYFNKSL